MSKGGFYLSRVFTLQKYAYRLTAGILPFFSFFAFTLKYIRLKICVIVKAT